MLLRSVTSMVLWIYVQSIRQANMRPCDCVVRSAADGYAAVRRSGLRRGERARPARLRQRPAPGDPRADHRPAPQLVHQRAPQRQRRRPQSLRLLRTTLRLQTSLRRFVIFISPLSDCEEALGRGTRSDSTYHAASCAWYCSAQHRCTWHVAAATVDMLVLLAGAGVSPGSVSSKAGRQEGREKATVVCQPAAAAQQSCGCRGRWT